MTLNLRELIRAQGRAMGWVAQQIGVTAPEMSTRICRRGQLQPSERALLAGALDVSIREIDEAARETERRPGLRHRDYTVRDIRQQVLAQICGDGQRT